MFAAQRPFSPENLPCSSNRRRFRPRIGPVRRARVFFARKRWHLDEQGRGASPATPQVARSATCGEDRASISSLGSPTGGAAPWDAHHLSIRSQCGARVARAGRQRDMLGARVDESTTTKLPLVQPPRRRYTRLPPWRRGMRRPVRPPSASPELTFRQGVGPTPRPSPRDQPIRGSSPSPRRSSRPRDRWIGGRSRPQGSGVRGRD